MLVNELPAVGALLRAIDSATVPYKVIDLVFTEPVGAITTLRLYGDSSIAI